MFTTLLTRESNMSWSYAQFKPTDSSVGVPKPPVCMSSKTWLESVGSISDFLCSTFDERAFIPLPLIDINSESVCQNPMHTGP